jgi:predicted nuclease of restriction endonuclease-like (RecB) superfamily
LAEIFFYQHAWMFSMFKLHNCMMFITFQRSNEINSHIYFIRPLFFNFLYLRNWKLLFVNLKDGEFHQDYSKWIAF